MLKTITAIKARQNLGQLMNEVVIKEDDYIIERAGKPLVAVIPIEKYRQIQRAKEGFFEWVDGLRNQTKNTAFTEIEEKVNKAVAAVRKSK